MTHYGGYAAHGMLLERMFDLLDEDQMRQLMIRMIESRIRMKEHRIEMMQYKVETYLCGARRQHEREGSLREGGGESGAPSSHTFGPHGSSLCGRG